MELKLALKVSDLDNVATIFANDINDGDKVEIRDKKGQSETVIVKGNVPYGHKIATKDSLSSLNTAFSQEGAYIHIPKNKLVEKPIQIFTILIFFSVSIKLIHIRL